MKYALKRILQIIPILFAITFLSFAMMHIAGSDVIEQKMLNTGEVASEEAINEARKELGLDKPFLVQYFLWLGNIFKGDMGQSYVSGKNVFDVFISKLPATLFLALISVLMTVVISIPLGILSALHQNRFIDYFVRFFSFIGNSMPNFFVSLLLMYLFAIKLDWFPIISRKISLYSVFLPAVTLAIAMSSKYLRQVRSAVLDELNKPYVIGAKARGINSHLIIWASVLKASLVTIVSLLAISIGSLLGGTAIVESIFMWDGVGKMAVDAISMRDYPVIQAYVMWMAIIYVLVNLVADLSYRFLDPRIRLGASAR
ncbi:MAG: ABC transporter permease [Treponemataceae bacterium]|nr:ABC transporter permease [Treponemataceae bacterium]